MNSKTTETESDVITVDEIVGTSLSEALARDFWDDGRSFHAAAHETAGE